MITLELFKGTGEGRKHLKRWEVCDSRMGVGAVNGRNRVS